MANWTWAAASRRGTSHSDAGERRQDAFQIATPPGGNGFFVAIACDGAGSASHGGQGASLTARTLAEAARHWLVAKGRLPHSRRIELWVGLARLRIATAAIMRDLAIGDFATTLVMAISDGTSTITAHIGDGAIIGHDVATGTWVALSWPEHGEYAATTYFVTDDAPRVRVARHDSGIDRLAVLTDGLERLGLDFAGGTPHAPFCEAMFHPLTASPMNGANHQLSIELATYLDSEKVVARTDDDKTLILAACM